MPQNIRDKNLLEYFKNHAECGGCFQSCSKKSGTLFCNNCSKWFHYKCQNRVRQAQTASSYTCEKCVASILPLFESDNIDFFCALYGEGKKPCCKKCGRECLDQIMQYFKCCVCEELYHLTCTKHSVMDLMAINCHHQLICSDKCSMSILPFSSFKYKGLLEHHIFTEKIRGKQSDPSVPPTAKKSPLNMWN